MLQRQSLDWWHIAVGGLAGNDAGPQRNKAGNGLASRHTLQGRANTKPKNTEPDLAEGLQVESMLPRSTHTIYSEARFRSHRVSRLTASHVARFAKNLPG